MLFIHIHPKLVIAAMTVLAGAAGVGYGISVGIKRKKDSVDHSTIKAAADVLSESVHEAPGQVEAIAVDAVNAVRINRLLKELAKIDRNNAGADEEIRLLKAEVFKILTSNRPTKFCQG